VDLLQAGVNIRCKNQMLVKERQHFIIDAKVVAPGLVSPHAVIFFRFVGNAKFVQLVGQGLVGVNVVLVQIAAPQSNLSSLRDLRFSAYCGTADSIKKLARRRSVRPVSTRVNEQCLPACSTNPDRQATAAVPVRTPAP
jgi:hypothetical protein